MPRAIPCAGYPSRTAAVLSLRSTGLSRAEIAPIVGLTQSQIASLELSAKKNRANRITVPAAILCDMAARGQPRGLTPYQMVRRVLAVVVSEKLIDAILDDGLQTSYKKEAA